MELFLVRPPFLVAIFEPYPSAVKLQGGRVELSSVPQGKLVAYKSYMIKIFNFIALQ